MFPTLLSLVVHVIILGIAVALNCYRYNGDLTNLGNTTCTGDVCLSRLDAASNLPLLDCGIGTYYNTWADGCYGVSSKFCICRKNLCNTQLQLANGKTSNKNITCYMAQPTTGITVPECIGYYCFSSATSVTNHPLYSCLTDPSELLPMAPFMGLCYRYDYVDANGARQNSSACICDTTDCNGNLTTLPPAGNTVSCFVDDTQLNQCTGDFCFLYQATGSNGTLKGCISSDKSNTSTLLMQASHTRDTYIDYYLCASSLCNANVTTAMASINKTQSTWTTIPTTTSVPVTLPMTTNDAWWTTPEGWNSSWDDGNFTWNGSDLNDTEDCNITNNTNCTNSGRRLGQGMWLETFGVPVLVVVAFAIFLG